MSEIDRMLAANEEWAGRFPGSRPVKPARGVAVVACMDSRMPLFPMLGLEVGDAHVIRNAGGVVTEDTIRSLTISQHLLGTRVGGQVEVGDRTPQHQVAHRPADQRDLVARGDEARTQRQRHRRHGGLRGGGRRVVGHEG